MKEVIKKLSLYLKHLKCRFKQTGTYILKLTGVVTIVWSVGYMNISVSWIYLIIVVYVSYICHKDTHKSLFERRLSFAKDEEGYLNKIPDLPSWVNFPDMERVDWMNKIIMRLWPSITAYMENFIETTLIPKVKENVPNISFKNIYFGETAPKIGGVRLYDNDKMSRDEIYMDLDVYFYSDAVITAAINNINFGVKNLEIKANLRIHVTPLLPKIPFMGALSLSLVQNPHIEFDFTDVGILLNVPALKTWLRESIVDAIAEIVVLPNRIPVQLIESANMNKLLFPMPDGVLRIQVIEAKSLKAMDVELLGVRNKSDPYVSIRVGAQKFKTKVINNSLNPKWDELFEAVVESTSYQSVELEVFDKDRNKDDFLGRAQVPIQVVYDKGSTDMWIQLQEIDTGSIHLALVWLTLSSEPTAFDLIETLDDNNQNPMSTAFCYLCIDSANNLKSPRGDGDPNPYVEVSVGNKKQSTPVQHKSRNPVWKAPFKFLIPNIYTATIIFQVKDEKSKKLMGSYVYKISDLLHENKMETFQTLRLKEVDEVCGLQIFISLRALIPSKRKMSMSPKAFIGSQSEFAMDLPTELVDSANRENTLRRRNVDNLDNEVFTEGDQRESDTGSIDSIIDDGPRMQVSMRHDDGANVLYVIIHDVLDLPSNLSVYIKLQMHPKDARHIKRKTEVQLTKPVMKFDAAFDFQMVKESLSISVLELNVKVDKKSILKRNPSIGCAQIDLSFVTPEMTENWYPITMRNADDVSGTSVKSDTSISNL